MNKTKRVKGFTLIELLIVIAILALLATATLIMINPQELSKRARDSARLAEISYFQTILNSKVAEASEDGVLCNYDPNPICSGSSYPVSSSTLKADGTGWIKVDFSQINGLTVNFLPLDPINDSNLKYTYFSNKLNWEINARLESEKYRSKMSFDGGDNSDKFEVGTSLTLLN